MVALGHEVYTLDLFLIELDLLFSVWFLSYRVGRDGAPWEQLWGRFTRPNRWSSPRTLKAKQLAVATPAEL